MKDSSYYIGFICGAVPCAPPTFFWAERGGVFCLCAAKEEGRGAACGTGAEPPRPQGLPLPPRRGPCDLFPPPPRQGNVLHHGGEADRPPRAPRGGVRGGVECARGAEVFCASARFWLFDALSPVRSGAVRRPEEGSAAARGGEADRAPRAPGVGGMGGVGLGAPGAACEGASRRQHPERWSARRKKGAACARPRRGDMAGITTELVP